MQTPASPEATAENPPRRGLLSAWEREVRNLPRSDLPRAQDARARLVRSLLEALRQPDFDAASLVPPAEDPGFELASHLLEYSALRRTAVELFVAQAPEGTLEELSRLQTWVDQALYADVLAFVEGRERALHRLQALQWDVRDREPGADFAGMFQVLADVCESVDSVALLVAQDEAELRLSARLGFPEELLSGAPSAASAIGQAWRTRRAVERCADAFCEEEPVPAGARGLVALPLDDGEQVLGVLQLGSTRVPRFSREDQILFRLLAGRLCAALSFSRARAEQARSRRLLQETLASLDALFAAAPAGLAFLDPELRYVRVNAALAEIHGLPGEAHLGHRAEQLLPEAVRAQLMAVLEQVREKREAVTGVELAAEVGQPPARREFLASIYPVLTPERRQRKELLGVGTLVVDVTEQRRKERALRDAAEFHERFVGIVSHDLRNPLQNIILSVERLAEEHLSYDQTRDLHRIRRNAQRMDGMIRDLQEFTRARLGGGLFVDPAPMDLGALCENIVEEWRALHPDRALSLSCEGDTHGRWDAQRLTQLLVNLVSNAFEYSPDGSEVALCVRGAAGEAHLSVKNLGGPISDEQRESLFEPFQHARHVGHRSHGAGLGLGLYIVHEISRAHGGSVHVTCQAGAVTFTVVLPRGA